MALATVLAGLVTLTAVAQFGQFGRGGAGGMSPAQLLANKSVQEELKLSAEDAEKLVKKVNDETTKVAVKVTEEGLSKDQAKRFKQIRLQQMRLNAFEDAEVVSALKLTDDQKKEIKGIEDDLRKDLADAFKEKSKDAREKINEMRKEALAKATKCLTDAQKKSWKEMVGEPFEIRLDFGGFGDKKGGGDKKKDF